MKVVLTSRAERAFKKVEGGRILLLEFIDFLKQKDAWKDSKVKKLVGTEFFRYKSGSYRIIFDKTGRVFTIFDVRKRNENTYKNL